MREPAQRQCVVGRSKLFAGRNLLRARHLLQSGAAPALAGQSADLIDEVGTSDHRGNLGAVRCDYRKAGRIGGGEGVRVIRQ